MQAPSACSASPTASRTWRARSRKRWRPDLALPGACLRIVAGEELEELADRLLCALGLDDLLLLPVHQNRLPHQIQLEQVVAHGAELGNTLVEGPADADDVGDHRVDISEQRL